VMDALVFILSLMFVSIFFFHLYSTSISRTQDLEMTRIRDEVALNTQNHAVSYVINETGYTNETSGEDHIYRNITVEKAIRNSLYLQYLEENTECTYNLSRLNRDIESVYERAAFNISHYHFAVIAEYEEAEFFISDVLEDTDPLDDPGEEPREWSAASRVTTLAREDIERIRIVLYIWR